MVTVIIWWKEYNYIIRNVIYIQNESYQLKSKPQLHYRYEKQYYNMYGNVIGKDETFKYWLYFMS